MTPLFSVIVPVFNRANVLERTLRSVLEQTCQDFEIVVVDDGSNDHPERIVERMGDPRIRIVRQQNGGGAAARNRGLDEARGQLVAPLDSDDIFLPRHLENMARLLKGKTGTASYARMVVDRGHGVTMLKPPRAIRPGEHMGTYLLCDRGFVPTITLALPTELARRVRYSHCRPAEDTDFALRLFIADCKFEMVEEPGAVWNDVHDPNRTSAGRNGDELIPWIEALKPDVPSRAYYGVYGWGIAKGVVVKQPWRALGYYLRAVLHGCYRPRLAAIVFLQIFLPNRLYRHIADRAIPFVPRRGVSARC